MRGFVGGIDLDAFPGIFDCVLAGEICEAAHDYGWWLVDYDRGRFG